MKPIPELSAVKPTDEFLVFEVASFTDPAKIYRVDMTLWNASGACSCEEFSCRIQPRLGKGDWTGETTCKHLRLVYRWFAVQVVRKAIEQRAGGRAYNASEPNL
jgi:hypothetical protein